MKLIVAIDEKWGIGKDGSLLLSIPEDMRFFREKTRTAVLVVGYATLQSFPGGKPLPHRRNIVLSTRRGLKVEGAEVCSSLDELFDLLGDTDPDNVFVIGGGSVYRQLFSYCDTAYVTKMFFDGRADTFMPDLDRELGWSLEEASEIKEHDGVRYQFLTYHNKTPRKND